MLPPTRVLIVEDDRAMAKMCAKLIRRLGHTVITAESCEEALELLACQWFDVAITDIQMPRMTGIELLVQLRNADRQVPVILMTGRTNVLSLEEACALGAAGYLHKPFDAATLTESLQRVLAFQHA